MTSKKDKELARKITEAHCRTWSANPLKNPIKGSTITFKGPTYNVFEQVCRDKFNIEVGESSEAGPSDAHAHAEPSLNLPKLPKNIDGIVMPQNKKQWSENKLINRDFFKILLLITNPKEKYINEYVFENMESYAKICELGLQYNLVPEEDIEKIRNYQERFTYFSVKENIKNIGIKFIRKEFIDIIDAYLGRFRHLDLNSNFIYLYPRNLKDALEFKELDLAKSAKDLQGDILRNGLDDSKYKTALEIVNLVGTINYYKLLYNDTEARLANWNSADNPVTNSASYIQLGINVKSLFNFIKEIKDLDERRNASYKSLTRKSKSVTLPTSISIDKITRHRLIPPEAVLVEEVNSDGTAIQNMRRAQGPPNQKEFSDYIEKYNTDRSSFNRHSILSKMEPLSRESLEAFPKKTRVQLLKELKTQCHYMKDTLTDKRFDRMAKKNLHLVVQIGPPGKKRCYYVRNIYKFWEESVKENKKFREPETRIAVTDEEKADIMRKVRYIKKNALDPELNRIKKDPNVHLIIDTILNSNGTIKYYVFNVHRTVGNLTYILYELGVLPGEIDLTQGENGAAYYSSSATVANVLEAFDKGRILEHNFIPYTCCKIHFKKENYWTGNQAEIHRKFKLFADEVYGLL